MLSFGMLFVALLTSCKSEDSGGGFPPLLSRTDSTTTSTVKAGVTPFIAFISLDSVNIGNISRINYTIEPRPNTFSKPVSVTFSAKYLTNDNYFISSSNSLNLPVFGLYAGYANQVDITLFFSDGSSRKLPSVTVATDTYAGGSSPVYFDNAYQGIAGNSSLYATPIIHTSRSASDNLGFDFFYVKNYLGTPAILDTDGNLRWIGTQPAVASGSASWYQNGFVVGEAGAATARSVPSGPAITRYELDGRISTSTISNPDYSYFNHNIDYGPTGLLGEFDTTSGVESTLAEFDPGNGTVLQEWDMAKIISDYMTAYGDNASLFVRPGVDWFHINAAAYDPRDDSLIVSSRENFLIKINRTTSQIVWIFGDPTKYWYTFPSLRAKALTLNSGGLYPIGQHGVSITPQGYLQVFNDGLQSLNEPSGTSAGAWLGYSTVSTYSIDEASQTATDVSEFDNGQSLSSAICSSGYTQPDGSMLIDYSVAYVLTSAPTYPNIGNTTRFVGLNPEKKIAFDIEYPTNSCGTGFNADVVHLESLNFN